MGKVRLGAALAVLGLFALVAIGGAGASVSNGGFETGSFTGWTVVNSGSGGWYVYTGTRSPLSGHTVFAPPEGTHGATTDQGGPGSHILYQDLVLPAASKDTLTLEPYYTNTGFGFATPASLSQNAGANQQYRIDIIKPTASITSLSADDILATAFQTHVGDARSKAPSVVSVDLSAFAGQTVRLRIAEVDNQGYFEAGIDNVQLTSTPLDSTPPTASPTQAPAANDAGWNSGDVAVDWNWADNEGGVGIDPANCTQTSTSSGEGTIALTATCADLAGNVGTATYTVKVDKTAPTITYSGNAGSYTVADTVNITCSASDAVSGVASTTCADISGPAWSFALGSNSFSATATDNAGNTGSGSTSFTVGVDFDSLCSLVGQFSTNADVTQGLCDKLAAAKGDAARGQAKAKDNVVRAFDHQVDAQTGKALTAAQAALLEKLVATL